MKLVVGLGNPGKEYAATRHNIGCRVVERLSERSGIRLQTPKFDSLFGRGTFAGEDVGLLCPQTYMNLSGKAVAAALRFLPVADPARDLIVVSDDVDLEFGQIRIKESGGAGGQKGLADIIARIGRKDFTRLRFGIGRSAHLSTSDHVLQKFSRAEEEQLAPRIDDAVAALELVIRGETAAAMTRYNAAEPNAKSKNLN